MEADRLEILIEAQAKSANRQLNLLINKLTKLSGILGTVGANSANINKLADALSGMSDISINVTKSFEGMSKSGKSMGGAFGKLTNMFGGIASGAGRMALSFTKAALGIRTASKHANSAGLSFRSLFRAIIPFYGIRSIFNWAKDAVKVSSDLTEIQNVVNVTFGNMTNKMEEFADTSIRDFGMSELSAKQFASRFQAMGTAMAVPVGKIQSAGKALRDMGVTYGETEESLADISINLTKLTADMASFYDRDQADIAKALESVYTGMTRPLRAYGLDLTQATVQEWALTHGIEANMATMTQAEKTLLRYQYVMYNTAAAQGDFARTQDTFANQMRILKQTVQQFAAVFGSAVIGAIKPAIAWLNQFMLHAINVAQTVVNALGAIFGWQLEITPGGVSEDDYEDYADGVEDIGDAGNDAAGGLGKAADAAKEFEESVMGFDELNKLSEAVSKVGGSGSGGTGSGGTGSGTGGGAVSAADIRLTPKEPLISQYKSQIDSLYELGEYISKTLQKTLEGIDWDKVYRKARNFGTGLASFLNGLIKPDLFATLGETIAGAINTKLNAFFAFGEIFSFTNLGNSLQTGITSALDNIDWDLAAKTAQTWGTKLAQGLNAFLTPSMFASVARAITNKLNNAITFLWSFGSTFNFDNLADCISTGINTAVENFNVEDLVSTLNLWALKVVGAITRAISNTNWRMLGVKVGYILRNIKWGEFLSGVGQLLGEAIQGVIDFAKGMLDPSGLGTPITNALDGIKGSIDNFTQGVDWDGIADSFGRIVKALEPAVAGFAEGFVTTFTTLGGLALDVIGTGLKLIAGALEDMDPAAIEAIGKALGGIVAALLGLKLVNGAVSTLSGIVSLIGGGAGAAGAAGAAGTAATGGLAGVFAGIATSVKEASGTFFKNGGWLFAVSEGTKLTARFVDLLKGGNGKLSDFTGAAESMSTVLASGLKITESAYQNIFNLNQSVEDGKIGFEEWASGVAEQLGKAGVSSEEAKAAFEGMFAAAGLEPTEAQSNFINALVSGLSDVTSTAEQAKGSVSHLGLDVGNAYSTIDSALRNLVVTNGEYITYQSELTHAFEDTYKSTGSVEQAYYALMQQMETLGLDSTALEEAIKGVNKEAEQTSEAFSLGSEEYAAFSDALQEVAENAHWSESRIEELQAELTNTDGAESAATAYERFKKTISDAGLSTEEFEKLVREKMPGAFDGMTTSAETSAEKVSGAYNSIATSAEGADEKSGSLKDGLFGFAGKVGAQALLMAVMGAAFTGIGDKAEGTEGKVESFGTKVSEMVTGLSTAKDEAKTSGEGVPEGFAEGAESKLSAVNQAMQAVLNPVLDMRTALQEHSPSRLTAGYGENVTLGFANGITSKLSEVQTAVTNMVGKITDAANGVKDTIRQNGVDVAGQFREGLESVSLSGVVTTWWNGMDFSGLFSNLENAGKNAAGYMVKGMKSVYMPKLDYVISEWRSHSLGNGGISYTPVYRGYWYAHGGFPNAGELFVAGEAGPEMVGKMGQKNVVANNIQITQGIKQAVIDGMMDVYMATRSDNSNQSPIVVESTLKVNDEVLARAVERGTARRQTRFSTVGATV